ncbi:MAG: glycosyltransferase [Bacteroidales bacterium]|nr:glycosyltransferase [Bacteroidales bacterium]
MDKILFKAWIINAYLLCIVVPFHVDINILSATLPAISLIIYIRNRKFYANRLVLLPVFYYLVIFLGIFLSTDAIGYRISVSDTQLNFLTIPLSFMVIDPKIISRNLNRFLFFFILGNLLISIHGMLYSLYWVIRDGNPVRAYELDQVFSTLHHHTYYSLNALLGLIFIIRLWFRPRNNLLMKVFLIISSLVINLTVFVASSRVGLVLLLVVDIYLVWRLIRSFEAFWQKAALTIAFLGILVIGYRWNNNLDYLRSDTGEADSARVESPNSFRAEDVNMKLAKSENIPADPLVPDTTVQAEKSLLQRFWDKGSKGTRQYIWAAALKEGWRRFPVGHGTARSNAVLKESLREKYLEGEVKLRSPNAHNQFLEIFLENGLPGLLIFFLLLYGLYREARLGRQKLVLAFLGIFIVIALFETILKRRLGVQSFSLFYVIFIIRMYYCRLQEKGNERRLVRITTVSTTMNVLLKGQLDFLRKKFSVTGITSPGPVVQEIREREGIRIHELKMSRSIRPLADFAALCKMTLLLDRELPDIVHTQTPKAGLIGILAARMAGVKHRVHSVVGLPVQEQKGMKRSLVAFADRMVYRNATRILSNSKGLKEYLINNKYVPKERVEVLGNGTTNGIDLDYFQETTELGKQAEKLKNELFGTEDVYIFLFVGRIVKDKGVNELVKAFCSLSESYPKARLLLVGRTEAANVISKDTEQEIETNSLIRSAGYQTDIRPYLSMADYFVFPTYREGFPNVVLQALAFNLPCIATDINGNNEVITSETHGLLIPVKDEAALSEAMKKAITGEAPSKQTLGDCRPMLKEKYDQKFIWGEYLRFYESL